MSTEKSQGLTPREMAKNGMPLSPTELIRLENALTVTEERIAELEAAKQWIPFRNQIERGKQARALMDDGKQIDIIFDEATGSYCDLTGHRITGTIMFLLRELPPMLGKESR